MKITAAGAVLGRCPAKPRSSAATEAPRKAFGISAERRDQWANKFWVVVEEVMKNSPDFTVRYDDPRIVNKLIEQGSSGTSISPLWTYFHRAGKVERIARGLYRLTGVK